MKVKDALESYFGRSAGGDGVHFKSERLCIGGNAFYLDYIFLKVFIKIAR